MPFRAKINAARKKTSPFLPVPEERLCLKRFTNRGLVIESSVTGCMRLLHWDQKLRGVADEGAQLCWWFKGRGLPRGWAL